MEYVYDVESGQIRASDVPEVVMESETSHNLRFGATFSIFIVICLVFIASWVIWRGCCIIHRAIAPNTVDLAIHNYKDTLPGSGVIGRRVQIFSPDIRQARVQADGIWFEKAADKSTGLTELVLGADRLISQVELTSGSVSGSESAKVLIRTDDGVKVWQEYKQLRPGVVVIQVKN
jgi:hypothetical protein